MSDPLTVVTAVAPETRAILAALRRTTRIPLAGFRAWQGSAGSRRVTLIQSGIGPARAAAALTTVRSGPALVVSAGFAGALVAGASPGDLVLPDRVVWEVDALTEQYDIPEAPLRAARAALPAHLAARVLVGSILSSRTVLASVDAKRDAALASGAVAVEMEAAGLITTARGQSAGVLVLRTILDTADVSLEGLPPDLDSSWGARARLVGMPHVWPRVMSLARQVPRASRALTEVVAAVLPAL